MQGALQLLRRDRLLQLGSEPRGDAEVGQLDPQRLRMDDDIFRLDVLMDHFIAVQRTDNGDELDGDIEKYGQFKRAARNDLLQRVSSEILQHQSITVKIRQQLDRPYDAVGMQSLHKLVLFL